VLGVISGCSSSGKTVSVNDFTAGPCRSVAPAVLQIGHLITVAHKKHGVSVQAQQELTAAQTQLRHMSVQPAGSRDLVTAIGFLRLRLDSGTYVPQLLTDVSAAQKNMERMCTAGG
jgi:hypothetical protein